MSSSNFRARRSTTICAPTPGFASVRSWRRAHLFEQVGELLDGDPALHDGDLLRLPFVVDAYRASRLG
jgi:hypothetical protein